MCAKRYENKITFVVTPKPNPAKVNSIVAAVEKIKHAIVELHADNRNIGESLQELNDTINEFMAEKSRENAAAGDGQKRAIPAIRGAAAAGGSRGGHDDAEPTAAELVKELEIDVASVLRRLDRMSLRNNRMQESLERVKIKLIRIVSTKDVK